MKRREKPGTRRNEEKLVSISVLERSLSILVENSASIRHVIGTCI